ncbi:MAG: ATP/GTP-binding protein, partial [Saprospiraceae bacterium]|nr:ATP/GTP-binding protein [Saprospiraceae bacterium]
MRRTLPTSEEFVKGIRAGDRVVLGKAITLVESARSEHHALAQEVIGHLLARGDRAESLRVAVTGAPGVGKSTLIEALGTHITREGKKVAVLAIDPTSSLSKGS